MNKYSEVFKGLSYFNEENMIVFTEDYRVFYRKGFTPEVVGLIRETIKKLESKFEKIIYISSEVSCKVNEIEMNGTSFFVVVEVPQLFDVEQSDAFVSQFSKLLDLINTDIVVMKDNEVIFRNKKVLKLLGLSRTKALTSHHDFQTKISLENFNRFLESKKSGEIILEVLGEDKEVHLVKTSISFITYKGENYHVSMVRDISQIKEIEDKYIAEIDYLRHSIRAIDEGVIVLNSINHITMFNKAASKLSGITPMEAQDQNVVDIIKILDKDKNLIEYINEAKYTNKDAYLYREDGMLWNVAVSVDTISNNKGEFLGKVLTIVDISEVKRREKEILYLSYHDVLTGLYNRTYLEETIHRLDTPRQIPFSVIMGDVNGLKMTNDIFGHDEGDNLLRNVSKLLKKVSRTEDIVGRWGGDEFVILLPKTSEEEAHMITKRIIRAFEDNASAYSVQGIKPSISLGYGVKTLEDVDIFETLRVAETNMYKRKMLSKESMYSSVIASMKTALYEKSHETEEHTNRLYSTCLKVAKHFDLTSDEFSDLELLCMLHDVGKIGIPDDILKYPGSLNDVQWEEMKKHSEIGYRIALTTPELKKVANYILCHHEHYDGSGYPKGISGEDIPLLDRILGVADAFDAMTNNRVYKSAISKEDAFLELTRCSGKQFDPKVVKLFIKENQNE